MSEDQETQDNTLDTWIMEQFTTINDSLTLFKMQITNLQKVIIYQLFYNGSKSNFKTLILQNNTSSTKCIILLNN
jgi:hypothetical protein